MRTGFARLALLAALLNGLAVLAACGGGADLTCDKPSRYQKAVQNERLKTPEDLDAPQPFLEMPVPEANPRPERPKGSPCLDLPPHISPTD
jgi:hypothetical protein